ncbi:MAG TPA: hypothetical protein VFI24_22245 [Pyrinomonadaceae bacterium]|nr:hypothetical protein [Pyrinomonadaceae bacterium]
MNSFSKRYLRLRPKELTDKHPSRLTTVYWLGIISLLPVALTSFIWLEVVRGIASRAIDGSGHYAAAQIYDREIFPDTFGWTNAYFAGMSFPNFYPPLFFWLVSALHHTGLVSFGAAFKIVVGVPLILMPLTFWALAYVHSGKDQGIAAGAAIACATIYSLGEIFQPNTGLDMSSTLLDGFYTQPLGFVLMLSWILVYLLPRQGIRQFAAASILLSLTVLANFFNAITAIIFIASVLICDLIAWIRATDPAQRTLQRQNFWWHFLSPWVAVALSAFWLAPMLSSYEYLVTRPLIRPLNQLITSPLWCWYFLAGIGAVIGWRRSTGRLRPYLLACAILLMALVFSGSFAPAWFPLQVFRFFSTINFLFCVPVGISLAYVVQLYLAKRKRSDAIGKPSLTKQILVVALSLAIIGVFGFAMSKKRLTKAFAFYTPETFPRISGPLEFARGHKDGRYLVEVLPSFADSGLVRSDCLALNAYLGAQGNQVISIVYREASPNSSFFNAELNAFSPYRENFGISSALLSDLDFVNQPLSQHIKRLQFIGVRYVIIGSAQMKERLRREPDVVTAHDIDDWTIFELRQPITAPVRTLNFRPALVVSDFTVKMRRRNQYDFMRLAEEEFNDAWFDVLLVHSTERRIDLLPQLNQFGALILDTYSYQDEAKALEVLKTFAQNRTLILLSSAAPLFSRIKSEIPRAVVIERPREELGDWIVAQDPSEHYDATSIRNTWKAIRAALDREKVAVATSEPQAPRLIAQTFHPKWVRSDRQPLYAATPFFTFGFFDQSPSINFQRTRSDRWALWCSAGALLFLIAVVLIRVNRGSSAALN